jgi:hypothetical protein
MSSISTATATCRFCAFVAPRSTLFDTSGPVRAARLLRHFAREVCPKRPTSIDADRLRTQENASQCRPKVGGPLQATQARERAERARAWTDDFSARVATANDRLSKAEGGRIDIEGPKDTSPWGLLSWAISTGLLVVLNEKRKREAKAVLEEAKRESRDVVARQDDAPFVGTAGRLEPEARLTDAPSRIDALEAALRSAGVLKTT